MRSVFIKRTLDKEVGVVVLYMCEKMCFFTAILSGEV